MADADKRQNLQAYPKEGVNEGPCTLTMRFIPTWPSTRITPAPRRTVASGRSQTPSAAYVMGLSGFCHEWPPGSLVPSI